jgi:hypothetical protein
LTISRLWESAQNLAYSFSGSDLGWRCAAGFELSVKILHEDAVRHGGLLLEFHGD